MQEGGAFSTMTREEVELFCIDHMVSVDIQPGEDALIFDFQSVTTPVDPQQDRSVTGFEAVMQVLHIILTDFKFEDDAFERAKQGLYAFRVIMDQTNNTPDVIDQNILYGQLFLQPTRTAEFIILDFNIQATGASFPV